MDRRRAAGPRGRRHRRGALTGDARPAAALARAAAVVDRLRSPGGCPWYASQTHASLLPYAVEEAHELVEAVESGDPAAVREELGDLLLQVVVHARVAQDGDEPFDLADVADELTAKLVRRNPHVFGPDPSPHLGAAEVDARWERLKRAEKPARASALDGVPATLGALARAQRLLTRAARTGLLAAAPPPVTSPDATPTPVTEEAVGDALLALVAAAQQAGVDAETALRGATAAWEAAARRAETAAPAPRD